MQGFALGGEVGPTTAFLIEAPPPEHRGFYGSLQSASQYASTFVAGCVGTGLAGCCSIRRRSGKLGLARGVSDRGR